MQATTLAALPRDSRFDTILYIDVLEHIADDRAELVEAARRLNPGGYLVVLSPAHQWLFTAFDAAIGHVRRYTAKSLRGFRLPDFVHGFFSTSIPSACSRRWRTYSFSRRRCRHRHKYDFGTKLWFQRPGFSIR